jgi:hypothetical protein
MNDVPETRSTGALFPLTILFAYLLRRRLIGKPPTAAR